jgi:hypothetical protein
MKQFLALPALALLALPAYAQDPAAAPVAKPLDPIIAKLAESLPKIFDLKWEGNHTFNAVKASEGTIAGTLNVTYQDQKHFKLSFDVKMKPGEASAAAGESEQNFTGNMIADGTHLWFISPLVTEQMGMDGIKVELAVFEEMLPQMMGQFGGMTGGAKDIPTMIQGVAEGYTLKEEGSTEALRRIVVEGESWKGFGQFDAQCWFPMAIQVGSEAEGAQISFTTNTFNLKDAFAEGAFAATGVDATKVMDMTGMIRASMPASGGGGDDLEF